MRSSQSDKVTPFATQAQKVTLDDSQKAFLTFLKKEKKVSTKGAAEFFKIAPRNARVKLKALEDLGFIIKIATSPKDPYGVYVITLKTTKKPSDP